MWDLNNLKYCTFSRILIALKNLPILWSAKFTFYTKNLEICEIILYSTSNVLIIIIVTF